MIGIITATNEEFDALKEALAVDSRDGATAPATAPDDSLGSASFHDEFITGTLGENPGEGVPVVAVQAGIGKVHAALCAQRLIDLYQPEAIINVGVAGALNPHLHVGDVVISRDALQHDFDTQYFGRPRGLISGFEKREFDADPQLISAAEEAAKELGIPHQVGRVVSGDQFICTAEKKEDLITEFQGDCAEMEGAAIAQVAAVNRVPFVILRAISDGADDGATVSYEQFVQYAAMRGTKLLIRMMEILGRAE